MRRQTAGMETAALAAMLAPQGGAKQDHPDIPAPGRLLGFPLPGLGRILSGREHQYATSSYSAASCTSISASKPHADQPGRGLPRQFNSIFGTLGKYASMISADLQLKIGSWPGSAWCTLMLRPRRPRRGAAGCATAANCSLPSVVALAGVCEGRLLISLAGRTSGSVVRRSDGDSLRAFSLREICCPTQG